MTPPYSGWLECYYTSVCRPIHLESARPRTCVLRLAWGASAINKPAVGNIHLRNCRRRSKTNANAMSKQRRASNKRWLSASSGLLTAFCLLLSAFCLLPSAYSPPHAQVRAHTDEGAVALGFMLRRLQTTASVLHTGAHPDDEDSALIARLARGDGARVGYLSLNRGEGGQNLIGPELFDALGVIRTEELLQARRLDGGDQFFTRTFDFGF